MRFYGDPAAAKVSSIKFQEADGSITKTLRPWQVPDAIVACSRRARELVLRDLVSFSGVALFDRACDRFTPEALCAALMGFEDSWRKDTHASVRSADVKTWTLSTARGTHVLALATMLEKQVEDSDRRPVSLVLSVNVSPEAATVGFPDSRCELFEIELCAAICQLCKQLHRCAPGSKVALRINGGVRQRRLLARIFDALEVSLRSATGLAAFELRLCRSYLGTLVRPEDTERLKEAAADGWRSRTLPLLLGARTRQPCVLTLLTPDLIRMIVMMVGAECHTHVKIVYGPHTASMRPPQLQPATFPGHDLSQLAQMLM